MADNTANPTPSPPPRARRRRQLETFEDCRRNLASVIRGVKARTIPPDIGRTLIYGLQTMIKLLEKTQLDARLDELEAQTTLLRAEADALSKHRTGQGA